MSNSLPAGENTLKQPFITSDAERTGKKNNGKQTVQDAAAVDKHGVVISIGKKLRGLPTFN